MKQGSLVVMCFILLMSFLVFPVSAQEGDKNYQTYIVDSFDTDSGVEWTWKVGASKFVTEGFPIVKTFDGMPRTLEVMYPDAKEEGSKQYLGVQIKFNRMGDNYFDIYPVKDGKRYEIPFKGIISRLDMWVWGADYLYSLEILVRDIEGRVHPLPVGWLNFKGWENLGIKIPTNIKQKSRYVGTSNKFSFVCFRIRTKPTEKVDNFYFFVDELKALTDVFVDSYDGYELVDAKFEETESEEGGK
ncbi:MAG: hypothetical protein CR988_00420 [Treponema sp.]|nr:MAG: hypothetical protein CR988_00420 [Treponema sp.]